MTSEDHTLGRLDPLVGGLMLVAGVMHLLMMESHMGHARGIGLFFLFTGAAQLCWSLLYIRRPSVELGIVGVSVLAIAPTLIYLITRVMRSPWSTGPEGVDTIGLTTQVAQVAAAAILIAEWPIRFPTTSVAKVAGVGFLLGIAGYSGALVAEPIGWLAEGESHGGHGGHDEHLDGHGGHGIGIRGESIIGTVGYYGPETGWGLQQTCGSRTDAMDCYLSYLEDALVAWGSVGAFDLLVEVMEVDAAANLASHGLAHGLGRLAYEAYGYDIELTLAECSYEVFQGCLHGSLQRYFDDLASQGQSLGGKQIRNVCNGATSQFETYACLHGVGHGVTLYTNYDRDASLGMCDALPDSFSQRSCQGGVFMENVVGYFDSLNPTAAGGHHGHGGHDEPPEFWVDPADPAYPCNAVAAKYGQECWKMQTSLILHFNPDYYRASLVCEEAGEFRLACYESLGRDAAPRGNYDPGRMTSHCVYGEQDARDQCVRGFSAGIVLNDNDPDAGITLCRALTDWAKAPCYDEVGRQGSQMLTSSESETLCATAEEPYVETCRAGAYLPAR